MTHRGPFQPLPFCDSAISPCPYLEPRAFHHIFFSPVQFRRGNDRAAFVGTWHSSKLNHDSLFGTQHGAQIHNPEIKSLML